MSSGTVEMIDGSLEKDGNFEEVRLSNLALEHVKEACFQKEGYQDVQNKFFWQKDVFSQNGAR